MGWCDAEKKNEMREKGKGREGRGREGRERKGRREGRRERREGGK